jgi:hypothetical protein
MTIGCDDTKLPYLPRFVANGLAKLGARRANRLVERFNILDPQIGKVRMVSELRRRNGVGTLACHDRAVTRAVE